MLNIITGMIVDIFFSRDIAKAGMALANDPEYINNLKVIQTYKKDMFKLRHNYDRIKKEQLDYYYTIYGIDLFNLERDEQLIVMQNIDSKQGKYHNLKPLDIKQQEINKQILEKRERIETEAMESQKIAMIKAHLKSEQKRKTRNIIISLIVFIFGVYLLIKNYIFFGGILVGFGGYFFLYNYKAIKTELKNKY